MVYENYDAKSLEPNLNDLASRLGKSGNILIFRGYLNNLHDNNDKQNTFIDLIKTIRKIGIWDMEDVGVVGKYTGGLFRSRPQLLFRRTTINGYTAPNSQLAAIPLAGDIEIMVPLTNVCTICAADWSLGVVQPEMARRVRCSTRLTSSVFASKLA